MGTKGYLSNIHTNIHGRNNVDLTLTFVLNSTHEDIVQLKGVSVNTVRTLSELLGRECEWSIWSGYGPWMESTIYKMEIAACSEKIERTLYCYDVNVEKWAVRS